VISGTGFYGSNDPTDSVKALKEDVRVRESNGMVQLMSACCTVICPRVQAICSDTCLSLFTGHDVFAAGGETGSIKLNIADMTSDVKAEYQLGVFHLLVCVPLICAAVQLWFWSRFTLHGKRLNWIKSMRSGLLKYATV